MDAVQLTTPCGMAYIVHYHRCWQVESNNFVAVATYVHAYIRCTKFSNVPHFEVLANYR